MRVQKRFNVRVEGSGPETMVFAHGFGCDQTMWRLLAPRFYDRYRVILFDMMGHGLSDLSLYDSGRYASLGGYATDVLDIVRHFATGPVFHVGHSVSATIGMLAAIRSPHLFQAQVMIAPSPSFCDDGDYAGGASREQIDTMLDFLKADYLAWAKVFAPLIMGTVRDGSLPIELSNSFCRNDPAIAGNFARIAMTADHRADLPKLSVPSLILQCTADNIVPVTVGEYMQRQIPSAELVLIDNAGHCPHLSNPGACAAAMEEFLARAGR